MPYLTAILGIAINFLSKYNARKDRKSFSFKFWIKDNWPETIQSFLFMISILIILKEAEIDSAAVYAWVSKFINLPEGVVVPAQLAVPFLAGLSINHVVYWYNKKYIKKIKSNP